MVILAVLAATAHAAPCAQAATTAQIEDHLQRAQQAYRELDVEAFTAAMDEAAYLVPCLDQPVSTDFAGHYHTLQGLRQFGAREDERAAQAFAAARSASGDEQLPDGLVPAGHAAHELYGRIPLENARSERIPAPVDGTVYFDGRPSDLRPMAWPSVVQVADGSGAVVDTAYLFPSEPMPSYEARPLPEVGAPRRHRVHVPLLGAAGGAAVAGGALYGLAALSEANMRDDHPEWTHDDLKSARVRTNALSVASASMGGLALVGAGLAVAVPW